MSRHRERFSPEDGGNFEEIPAGRYLVKVLGAAVEPWSQTNPDLKWVLTLEILAGPFARRRLWLNIGMTEKAKGIRLGALSALGVNWKDQDVDLIEDVVNRRAIAETFVDETYGTKVKRLRSDEKVAPGQATVDEFDSGQVLGREGEEDSVPF